MAFKFGVANGPGIVQNGLIFNLDPRQRGSYNPYPSGNTSVTDISPYVNKGTLNGVFPFNTFVGGQLTGDGFYFNGFGDIPFNTIEVPSPGVQDDTRNPIPTDVWYPVYDNFTMEYWVTPGGGILQYGETTSGVVGTIGQAYLTDAKSLDGVNDSGLCVSIGQNGVQLFAHGDNLMPCILSYENLDEITWGLSVICVQIVVINKQPSVYINGVFARTGLTAPRNRLELRTEGLVGSVAYGSFNGDLYNAKYYKRPLSSTELLQNWDALKGRYGY